jgi:hypothetical protein
MNHFRLHLKHTQPLTIKEKGFEPQISFMFKKKTRVEINELTISSLKSKLWKQEIY